jgi:hypothetical protein
MDGHSVCNSGFQLVLALPHTNHTCTNQVNFGGHLVALVALVALDHQAVIGFFVQLLDPH